MAPITTARKRTLQDALDGGAEGVRTPDLLNAIQALYQLSYDPVQSENNVSWRNRNCQNEIQGSLTLHKPSSASSSGILPIILPHMILPFPDLTHFGRGSRALPPSPILAIVAATAHIVYTNTLTPRIAQSVYEFEFQTHCQRAFPHHLLRSRTPAP